uniref:Uncharacterized protein n=1 Tax=Oryza punctata TaxID=4537 RepID=A0A0E0JI34_ORYPU
MGDRVPDQVSTLFSMKNEERVTYKDDGGPGPHDPDIPGFLGSLSKAGTPGPNSEMGPEPPRAPEEKKREANTDQEKIKTSLDELSGFDFLKVRFKSEGVP